MQLHDPYTTATPSQRLAAAARQIRLAKIAEGAKNPKPKFPITEIEHVPASPGFTFSDWARRQEVIHPLPKNPWFSIEAEITPEPEPRIAIKDIQRAVAKFYGVTMNDLVCERRQAYIVKPRQVAMFLAKDLTRRSLPEIGRKFGDRDHTTVLHAIKKIERLATADPVLRAEIEAIKTKIAEQLG